MIVLKSVYGTTARSFVLHCPVKDIQNLTTSEPFERYARKKFFLSAPGT